nr:hypothetical protein [Tanacetum cinerariifolium]
MALSWRGVYLNAVMESTTLSDASDLFALTVHGLESLNSRIECDPYFQDLFLIKQIHEHHHQTRSKRIEKQETKEDGD